MRFLPPLEMRLSSIAPNPVESREGPPNSTVPLTSQRHPEKLHEVTGTRADSEIFQQRGGAVKALTPKALKKDSRGLSRGRRETLVSLAFCRGP